MKALCMISGGLDSALAAKLMLEQGLAVVGVCFYSAYTGKPETAFAVSDELGIPLRTVKLGADFFRMIRHPKHGYGAGLNPCIDCRIFILKKAKKLMKPLGADFIVTGEVLGERPMSQHMKSLRIVEEECGLRGKLLRPLSAKRLPPTDPEKKGWVDRAKLLDIQGRQRKRQFALAKQYGLRGFETPAGGCMLTNREFAAKLRDFFGHGGTLEEKELEAIKHGRHFRLGGNKIIVGRNEPENRILAKLRNRDDFLFKVPITETPTTILKGPKTAEAITLAGQLTVHYSDATGNKVRVKYGKKLEKEVTVSRIAKSRIEKLRVC
jgi:tRNA-specific 2-thiouridylase